MWLSEEMTESHPLFDKVEYLTQQSCEKHEGEINYKNVNRKYISFNLRDKPLMLLVGMTLKPFGFLQNMQDWLIDSKVRFFRVWAETSIAKRGEVHLRSLYLKSPEKFFNVEFENANSSRMKIAKCGYIINEVCSTKRMSLHDKEEFSGVMDGFRKNMQKEESQFALENQQSKKSEEHEEDEKLLSING